jgi:adenylylsulfate kinase
MVIWITGLPGSGKTTIATKLLEKLRSHELQSVLLDGDELRTALNKFNYDKESRQNLAFTYAKLSRMLSLQGTIVICATVSMFHSVRAWNRENNVNYYEVYIKVTAETLMIRNQKQLYSDASDNKLENVPGINQKIEEPKNPDLVINNGEGSDVEELVSLIYEKIGK